MKVDARVTYPQAHAPVDESLARAVIELADAIARGDDKKFRAMVTPDQQTILDGLVSSGEWADSTKKIEAVRVVSMSESLGDGSNATAARVTLAVQEPGAAYTLGWSGKKSGTTWTFTGSPTAATEKARASEFDGSAGSAAAPAPDAAPAAAAASAADTPAILAHAILTLMKRMNDLGQAGLSESALDAQAKAMGQSLDAWKALAAQGKAAIDRGVEVDEMTARMVLDAGLAMAATTGGKINEDQVIQWASSVINWPQNKMKALRGGAPKGGAGGG